jgi:hypothetical protein
MCNIHHLSNTILESKRTPRNSMGMQPMKDAVQNDEEKKNI